MNDEIKTPGEPDKPDESPFNESLNEEFDFGEEATPPSPVYSERKGPNKKLLMGGGVIVVLLILAMGYKFLGKQKPTAPTPSVSRIKTETPTRPTPPPPTQQPANEQSFSEIAQAFSSADHAASGTTPATGTGTNQGSSTKSPKEGSIQELQKELFTPEAAPTPPPPPPPSSQVQTQGGGPTTIPLLPVNKTVASTESPPANITEELHKLNQQNQYILNQIKYLDSYTKEVSDNLNKLTEAINGMDSRISTLTNTTTLLSKDVGSVKSDVGQVQRVLKEDGLDESTDVISPTPRARCETERKSGHAIIEEPEYVVHAVIPGRAWLKSQRGQIVTVTEGDTVGNYGKVLVIDAANGVVLTSSGVTFR